MKTKREGHLSVLFHPLVWKWFHSSFSGPTEIQQLAWPIITSGKHALISAPTGTGKTLTAFLWPISQLLSGAWETGVLSVLYVSPLKALNNDIQRNLHSPLEELNRVFDQAGEQRPDIRVVTRSGDTPQSERQRMLRKPPDILITTPESLNLIISSRRAREILGDIKTVILDEIHAVAGEKRGTHLITAVDRLVLLAGEFQRIAVSATIRPMASVADFVGGYRRIGPGGDGTYEKRSVEIVEVESAKKIELSIEYPTNQAGFGMRNTIWEAIGQRIVDIVHEHRSTLVFVNSRRMAEQMTVNINAAGEMLAYAHHGSLSRELRQVVEQRLKAGELSAIVATSSLEMGIDIGDLDMVVLVQTPFAVSSTVQRLGRSGHSVEETSKGLLFGGHGRDLLHAAVVSELVKNKDVEPLHPICEPLDVLAQIIVSMLGIREWKQEELYAFLRTSYPFHKLAKEQFLSVLEMLAGRYEKTRIRELRPRISIDKVDGTLKGREGALLLVYSSGGTIPDQGYFQMRTQDDRSLIGELDEEFVWERRVGDTFMFGNQGWRVTNIDHQKVEVVPWKGPIKISPFWRADPINRDYHLSKHLAGFLETWNQDLDGPGLKNLLREERSMSDEAAEALIEFLHKQRQATGTDLPHRHHIVVEHTFDPSSGRDYQQIFVHTLWGNRVNYPLSLALSAAWEQDHYPIDVLSDNDTIFLSLVQDEMYSDESERSFEVDVAALIRSIRPERITELIQTKLESSGFFGARFRENAGRALLLPRASINRRVPLWLNRLKSKKLLDAVSSYRNFPITLETWRTCVKDEFEIEVLGRLLEEIEAGEILISEVRTQSPSPFAAGAIYQNMNHQVYQDDTPGGTRAASVDSDVLKEAVFSSRIRPSLRSNLVEEFRKKLHRIEAGYTPRDSRELIDWIGERLLITQAEWGEMIDALQRDRGEGAEEVFEATEVAERVFTLQLPGGRYRCYASVESAALLSLTLGVDPQDMMIEALDQRNESSQLIKIVHRLAASESQRSAELEESEPSLESLLSQWLSYYGPVHLSQVSDCFGFESDERDELLTSMEEAGMIVRDTLTEETTEIELCDAENLERILAFSRRRARANIETRPVKELQLFLATWQMVDQKYQSRDDLKRVLNVLMGYPGRAAQWEEDIFPARVNGYLRGWIDELLLQTGLEWFGCGNERIGFCFSEDYELFAFNPEPSGIEKLFPDPAGRYTFWDLRKNANISSGELAKKLWKEVWAGRLKCDSFEVLRRGVLERFSIREDSRSSSIVEEGASDSDPGGLGLPKPWGRGTGRTARRAGGFAQWSASRPIGGNWFLQHQIESGDLIEEEEIRKDRVRQLLKRYGVIFRELLEVELKELRWSRLFRTLRIMELGGEIVAGRFFERIPGLQFATPTAVRMLQEKLDEDSVYWLNAADPASLAGVDIPALKAILPERFASTYLVFHGSTLAVIARKRGTELEIRVEADNPDLHRYFDFARAHVNRDFNPVKAVKVLSINGEPALESPYCDVLVGLGFRREYKGLSLWAY